MALRAATRSMVLPTRGSTNSLNGSALEQRDDAKKNMLKAMRPLPTQHYWNIYFDRQQKDPAKASEVSYTASLEQIGSQIESVQDFWRYNNNTPVEQIKMRESIYLFKQGFRPIWEDRRNINGGSWTFRVPKSNGPDFWTRVQLMAIGEKLQCCLEPGDQLCGVGLSVRFNSHLISIWHRDASKEKSIEAILRLVLDELPAELQPKVDNYFYKKHSDHASFRAPATTSKEILPSKIQASV
ncbi:Eukaryotic translation initiation factor 4E type 3 [Erysiphe necator]|uniref:Putative translation initiation factor 4e n=1 Tax=Uncinula necator TaxID=52586 RepID=A0A0B1P5Q2_UNCNE|nr:Eukaryotic translation initiation factor 4E type 3 [Erysiphe necator]KHJ31999.1 putative translation initiation factor 4e [Erysiphe necator]